MSNQFNDFLKSYPNASLSVVLKEDIRVVDGDTLRIYEGKENNEYIRLPCINCPEKLSQEGQLATEKTLGFIDSHPLFLIIKIGKGYYGRTIGMVFPIQLEQDLTSYLLEEKAGDFKDYNNSYCQLYESKP